MEEPVHKKIKYVHGDMDVVIPPSRPSYEPLFASQEVDKNFSTFAPKNQVDTSKSVHWEGDTEDLIRSHYLMSESYPTDDVSDAPLGTIAQQQRRQRLEDNGYVVDSELSAASSSDFPDDIDTLVVSRPSEKKYYVIHRGSLTPTDFAVDAMVHPITTKGANAISKVMGNQTNQQLKKKYGDNVGQFSKLGLKSKWYPGKTWYELTAAKNYVQGGLINEAVKLGSLGFLDANRAVQPLTSTISYNQARLINEKQNPRLQKSLQVSHDARQKYRMEDGWQEYQLGHSLGGYLAEESARDVSKKGIKYPSNARVITYNKPRMSTVPSVTNKNQIDVIRKGDPLKGHHEVNPIFLNDVKYNARDVTYNHGFNDTTGLDWARASQEKKKRKWSSSYYLRNITL